jgi:HEPN domain-containing protein
MEEYNFWIRQSADDLLWTKSSLKNGIWYGACFSAQQVVEKALKAFLIFKNRPLKKVHDVIGLLNDCVSLNKQFKNLENEVKTVYPYYIETRYPSYEEVDIFTKDQAEEAYRQARIVLKFVKDKVSSV